MITAIVQFQLPQPVTLEGARDVFLESAPQFRAVPGLLRKNYLLGEDGRTMGGAYLWQDRPAAEVFYSDVLRPYLRERYGVEPQITFFATPVVVDNVAGETITA